MAKSQPCAMGTARNTRFVALDSWRGICAIFVAIHNVNFGYWMPQRAFVAHASLFVDFFFVLSGFVITHAYGDRLASGRELGAFMLRRLGRLWPLHAALLALLVGVALLKFLAAGILRLPPMAAPLEGSGIRTVLTNLLLVQAFDAPSRLTWNTPSWSISTELWAYFLFAVVCTVSRRRRPPLFLMATVAATAGTLIFLLSPDYLETNTDYAFLRCLYGFFAGHLVYRAWAVAPEPRRSGGAIELAALALALGFVLVVGSDLFSMAAPLVFGFAVWTFAHEKGSLSKLLRARPFALLGTWSYSIYMVHWLARSILVRADPYLGQARPGWQMDGLLVVYLIVAVALAAATYALIESPARSVFNRLADRVFLEGQPSA